ncbi:MAG: hypothetical protein CMG71_06385 [Candidatus Marinimicrobia bacterium]|nr:hypothetical protein [Candidatus Neomarinimicrobiota bacterium]
MAEEQNREIDAQKEFLMAKINEMTDGVAPGYGEAFLEELMNRLEKTVSEFNEEVTVLLESLQAQSAERHEKLQELIEQGGEAPMQEPASGVTSAESEMSDWEKRLESSGDPAAWEENPVEESEGEEKEELKKKGFFGRRKKKKKK